MSPGLIMSPLPRSPLRGLCQSGILIHRQRGEVATPECFDSWAICHQTRRWDLDGFDLLSPWIESTMYKTIRNPHFFKTTFFVAGKKWINYSRRKKMTIYHRSSGIFTARPKSPNLPSLGKGQRAQLEIQYPDCIPLSDADLSFNAE